MGAQPVKRGMHSQCLSIPGPHPAWSLGFRQTIGRSPIGSDPTSAMTAWLAAQTSSLEGRLRLNGR